MNRAAAVAVVGRAESREERLVRAGALWPGVRQAVASRTAASLTAKLLEERLDEHAGVEGLTASDVRDVAATAVRVADEVLLAMVEVRT